MYIHRATFLVLPAPRNGVCRAVSHLPRHPFLGPVTPQVLKDRVRILLSSLCPCVWHMVDDSKSIKWNKMNWLTYEDVYIPGLWPHEFLGKTKEILYFASLTVIYLSILHYSIMPLLIGSTYAHQELLRARCSTSVGAVWAKMMIKMWILPMRPLWPSMEDEREINGNEKTIES